ncbi:MAG: hypothetical protein HYY28_06355 [Betaproteobacteria bacterium]|nr:hypothetical protein [Betaproteobacteria bacterium]
MRGCISQAGFEKHGAKSFNQKFPGFDTDIHGLVADETSRRSRYFVDCVAQS